MNSLARSTGGASGAALFGALIFSLMPNTDARTLLQHAGALEVEDVVRAFHHAFLCVAALAALAAYTASRIPRVTLWQPSAQRADGA
jgi:hypothetical protein